MRLEGAERLILQAILGLQGDSGNYVADARIAEETDLALDDVRNWLLTFRTRDGSGTGPILLSQATFLLAHIANSGPVPLSPVQWPYPLIGSS